MSKFIIASLFPVGPQTCACLIVYSREGNKIAANNTVISLMRFIYQVTASRDISSALVRSSDGRFSSPLANDSTKRRASNHLGKQQRFIRTWLEFAGRAQRRSPCSSARSRCAAPRGRCSLAGGAARRKGGWWPVLLTRSGLTDTPRMCVSPARTP